LGVDERTVTSARQRRRAVRRRTLYRQRRVGAVAVMIALVIVVASLGTGASAPHSHRRGGAGAHPSEVVPGGPVAPASVGGLAALWAAQNVVGAQPATAAAYQAASKLAGPAGYLLIADRGNNRILVVDARGNTAFSFPTQADLAAGRRLVYNDDTFVQPGGQALIANEEDNHAIVQVGLADRSLRVLFGHPGELGSDQTHLNTPDDAYALPDGSFTVADAYNCRILFVQAGRIVRQYGQSGVCRHDPPRAFGAVNGDTPVPGGGILVSEIPGNWIDEIGPEGRLVFSVRAPVSYPSDPQPLPGGRVLLADYANPGHVLIIDHAGTVLWRYGPAEGYRRLDHPSLAMALPNGDVAVNDDYRHRVVVIDPRTNRIVWQYGHTDQPGSAPGYLNTPDGMDFIPAGPDGSPDYAAVVHP
jgi:outer membrane protein assembly factor BamB